MYSIETNPRKVTLFLGGPEGILRYMKHLKQFSLIAIENNVHIYQYTLENRVVK